MFITIIDLMIDKQKQRVLKEEILKYIYTKTLHMFDQKVEKGSLLTKFLGKSLSSNLQIYSRVPNKQPPTANYFFQKFSTQAA